MKPEDFHIYKERALTGNPWLAMDIEQQMEVMNRLEENYLHNRIMRMCEENLKNDIPFEKVYIVPTRGCGKTNIMKKLRDRPTDIWDAFRIIETAVGLKGE